MGLMYIPSSSVTPVAGRMEPTRNRLAKTEFGYSEESDGEMETSRPIDRKLKDFLDNELLKASALTATATSKRSIR
jgi:hypothetical protein